MTGGEFFEIGQRPLTPAEATCRAMFLDFDNPSRPRRVPVIVGPSEEELTAKEIERILATLNDYFATREVEFFAEPPPDRSYHTIYVNDEFEEERVDEPTPDRDSVVDIGATIVESDSERKLIDSIAARAEAILKQKQTME